MLALLPSDRRALLDNGFVIIRGPVPEEELRALRTAYDAAIASADPADVAIGKTTTRLHDLVNRGPEFDPLYIHPPLLAGCELVINEPFRLSTLLARTVRPGAPTQELHVDYPADIDGWPMLGFILMVDAFNSKNGATRFVPRSQAFNMPVAGARPYARDETYACGPAGAMILYNGSVWHGHGANVSNEPRRSVQGAFIRRRATPATNFLERLRPETAVRLTPVARRLLDI